MLKKIIHLSKKLFYWDMLYRGKPAEYPFLSAEFKKIYDELHKQEDEIIEKVKKIYTKIPKEKWEVHKKIQQDGFAHIKKECGARSVDDNMQLNLTPIEFGLFLRKYTDHQLEKNGIDPKKIDIYYDYNSLPHSFKRSNDSLDDSFTYFQGFSNSRDFLHYKDFFTHSTTKRPALFVNTNSAI